MGRRYGFWGGVLVLAALLPAVPAVKGWAAASPFLLPFYWGIVLAAILCLLPRVYAPGRTRLGGTAVGYAGSGAVIYLALGFLAGVLLQALAATPYDLSPAGIFYNLVAVVPPVAAKEYIRAYGLGAAWRSGKHRSAAVILLTLALALVEVNFSKIGKLSGTEQLFIYVATDVAPVLTTHILLTVLVWYGDAPAGIVYLAVVRMFERVFPFLPDLPWIADSAIGISFPVLYAMFVRDRCRYLKGDPDREAEEGVVGYLAALSLAVSFSWFCVGVFPVYPSIVLTGSMEPEIRPGDVVLIRKILDEKELYQLSEGDVVNFTREDITITHRIQEVLTDEAGNVSFRTKGDNNASADEQIVLPNDVNGTVRKVVPKVGLPILILKSGKEMPEGVVDDGRTERVEERTKERAGE